MAIISKQYFLAVCLSIFFILWAFPVQSETDRESLNSVYSIFAGSIGIGTGMIVNKENLPLSIFLKDTSRDTRFIKGNVGEKMMDKLNKKWKKIDTKIGEQGIDGLYVRKDARGNVRQVLVGEAKTGSATLSKTKHGNQMSNEWIRRNLNRKINQIENDKAKAVKNGEVRKIKSYDNQIKALKQTSRFIEKGVYRKQSYNCLLYNTKIRNGFLIVEVSKLDFNGIPISHKEVQRIPLTGKLTRKQADMMKIFYNAYKQELINTQKLSERQARKAVENLKQNIRNGSIKRDSDLHKYTSSILKNANRRAAFISSAKTAGFGGLMGGGIVVITEYYQTGKMNWSTFAEGVTYGSVDGVATTTVRGVLNTKKSQLMKLNKLPGIKNTIFDKAGKLSKVPACGLSRIRQNYAGRSVLKAASNSPRLRFLGKAGIAGAAVTVGFIGYQLYQGNIDSETAAVQLGSSALAAAGGTLAASWAGSSSTGAAIGSVFPGFGTAIGLVTGTAIGCGTMFYYQHFKMDEMLQEALVQARIDADIEEQLKRQDSREFRLKTLELERQARSMLQSIDLN